MILRWCMHPIQKQMTLLTNWIVQVSTKHSLHFAFCFSFIRCRRRRRCRYSTSAPMFYLSLSVSASTHSMNYTIKISVSALNANPFVIISSAPNWDPTDNCYFFFARERIMQSGRKIHFLRDLSLWSIESVGGRRKRVHLVGYNESRWRWRRPQLV